MEERKWERKQEGKRKKGNEEERKRKEARNSCVSNE